MLDKNENYTLKFIEERILIQKQDSPEKKSSNESPSKSSKEQQSGFFELLISNMDMDVRSMA